VTAQDLFKHIMRDLVGPDLRAMGFRGSYTRGFWIEEGDYSSGLWTQKSRYSTKTEVEFWIHLSAIHNRTNRCYWLKQMHSLIPGMTPGHWTIEAGSPPGRVAESVLDGICHYGLPAMQAAMDSPGIPADPGVGWARTFPCADENDLDDGPPALDEIAWVLRPTGQPADAWFALLADESAAGRLDALNAITENAADDARCQVVLIDRRKRDPSRRVRRYATDLFSPYANNDDCEGPPALDELAWALQPTGQPADEWFARLASESSAERGDALRMITEKSADDPRCRAVLLDRLEHDPSYGVRRYAAKLLTTVNADQSVRQALRDAAAFDEDLEVRWAARYALRLTAPQSEKRTSRPATASASVGVPCEPKKPR
jgi:hypothetical protein